MTYIKMINGRKLVPTGSSGRPSAVRGTTDTRPTRKLRNFYFEHE